MSIVEKLLKQKYAIQKSRSRCQFNYKANLGFPTEKGANQ